MNNENEFFETLKTAMLDACAYNIANSIREASEKLGEYERKQFYLKMIEILETELSKLEGGFWVEGD